MSADTNPIAPFIANRGFLLLDGGLSTELERQGADLDHELWSSAVLLNDPGVLIAAHRAFLEAGADVISTGTYQASEAGFQRAGLNAAEAREQMAGAVRLAVDERDRFFAGQGAGGLRPLVAASLGPYGACLHDGSEYHGQYQIGFDQLKDFHRPRIEVLAQGGADLFAFETIPSLEEARALVELLEEFPRIQCWLSFSCRDGEHVSHGERFADCAALARSRSQILAIGVNCTAPENVAPLLRSAAEAVAPLVVYPNSGETWNAQLQQWQGDACETMDVALWHKLGARLIGGCCRTTSADIARLRSILEQHVSNGLA